MRIFFVAVLLCIIAPVSAKPRGRVVYYQDFGCNDTADAPVSAVPVKECIYPQLTAEASFSGCYAVRKRAFYNGVDGGASQWYAQTDHTHPNDSSRGCFLQVDCGLQNELFYTFIVKGIPPDTHLQISLWVVNLYTAYQKTCFEREHWEVNEPDLDFIVFSADDTELARYRIGPLKADPALPEALDYRYSAEWVNYVLDFILETETPYLLFAIGNRTTTSPGNDLGIDDISVTVY